MRLDWLEDFAALFDAPSLTEAAVRRNVSQPAFSRRIQLLEQWLNAPILDRQRKPVSLTEAALDHEVQLRALLSALYELKASIRAASSNQRPIRVGAQHSMSVQPLLESLRSASGEPGLSFRLKTGDRADCVAWFVQGNIDILLCYGAPEGPPILPPALARVFRTGGDTLVPVAASAVIEAHASSGSSLPVDLLVYPRESFFGEMLWPQQLNRLVTERDCRVVFETSLVFSLMELALAGAGFAWLPHRLVQPGLRSGELAVATGIVGQPLALDILLACRAMPGEGRTDLPALLDRLFAAVGP